MIKFDTFFSHKGLDAKVGITVHHESGATILSFLAQGNSQIKDKVTKEVIGYKKRNPDRVALVDHLIPQLPNGSTVRYGSLSKGQMETGDLSPQRMRRLYSAGGKFQFDIAIFGLFPPMPILTSNCEDREKFIQMVCQRFDLVPVKGRGIKIFRDDGQLEVIQRQRGAEVAMRALEPDLAVHRSDPTSCLAERHEVDHSNFLPETPQIRGKYQGNFAKTKEPTNVNTQI